MPTYEYTCKQCNTKLEILQKITDQPIQNCPECKSASLQRGPGGGIGLQFKGSGFYITDYKQKEDSSKSKSALPANDSCPCGKEKNSCETK